ncbi:MAG: beta-hydroxyacyl-ACP dehydratase [Planctomycetes bacterium]|nr:beta-hydroxyacyl-ACP dehydratase [Planctomycetota bacterium]
MLDRAAIEARLPHRAPFLFLDRAWMDGAGAPAATLIAEWRVPESADFFRGHYPGNPLTPGVILCEHAFQAGAVLLCERGARFGATSDVPVLARIEKAKFRRMVRPGETLTTKVVLVESVGPASYLEAKASVAGELALEVRCVLSRAARPDGRKDDDT